MRIKNHFTRLLLFILCGLFLISGVSGDFDQYGIMTLSGEEIEAQMASMPILTYEDSAAFSIESGFPDEVDLLPLLTYNPVTRDQGSCRNGWVWAATGAANIALAVDSGIYNELSVQYLNSLMNDGGITGPFACDGGFPSTFVNFYLGPDSEEKMIPVTNGNATFADGNGGQPGGWQSWGQGFKSNIPGTDIEKDPYYPVSSMETGILNPLISQGIFITQMKALLASDVPLVMSFYLPDATAWAEFHQFWEGPDEVLFPLDAYNGIPYDIRNGAGGHTALIVGYNTTDPDPAHHYWTVLNSWGVTADRPQGTFRIPMYMNYQSKSLYYNFYNMLFSPVLVTFGEVLPGPGPGFSERVLITPDGGTGYSWSESGRLLTIHSSGSYGFADMKFSEFSIYVNAPDVSIDGRRWSDAETPTDKQVLITGYHYPDGYTIGIHGNENAIPSLDLSHVFVSFFSADESLIGISGVRNIFDSSIKVIGQHPMFNVGIDEVYGTFDRNDIILFGSNDASLAGIGTLYGKMAGGSIVIDVPRLSKGFDIIGIIDVSEGAEVSGGTFWLSGHGYGYATGIYSLRGSVTGGDFKMLSYLGEGISVIDGGSVSGGVFHVGGFALANGVTYVIDGSVDGGEFFVYGDDVVGIQDLDEGGVVSGGLFIISGTDGVGIYSISDDALVKGGEFRVYGYGQAGGIFYMSDDAVIEGGSFSASSSGMGGITVGMVFCEGGSITGGSFSAESAGTAFGIVSNKCAISGGEFFAVSTFGHAIGIGDALVLPDAGAVTAWAKTKDKAIAVFTPSLSDGKDEANYSFVYKGRAYIGDTTTYSVNDSLLREIYGTGKAIIISPHPEPDEGAVIVPGEDLIIKKDRKKTIPISFDSRPGYDLQSIVINDFALDEIVKYVMLPRDRNYTVRAIAVPNQIHVDFEGDVLNGTVPLTVTFTGEAKYADGDVSWFWDFGNGERGYDQVVTTTYTMPGTYAVLATGTDSSSSATARKTAYITIEKSF